MAKQEVSTHTHSESELNRVAQAYGLSTPLKAHTRLFGGYSGSTYKLVDKDDRAAVLRVERLLVEAALAAQREHLLRVLRALFPVAWPYCRPVRTTCL